MWRAGDPTVRFTAIVLVKTVSLKADFYPICIQKKAGLDKWPTRLIILLPGQVVILESTPLPVYLDLESRNRLPLP
jgi:hypothetical protein